ncbi:hypothetical protein E3P92_02758 [Wallemia ichthyophaga]|uniref:Uncharacterized protein n=1 Tax=Wallemia ichthyophaga TaxID=245174 RepID=A0A4T0F142_WALIC|nr:hypothetical protein E3P91_02711 [Wallemia ichthyophaga]TIA80849.1 hypothetical protein E3P98_02451 [Wallemia ichthyophaga]TIA89719.1 hypothetical protein E3P97_02883 [Wallemia ichthyophaga]TIA98347.1 hypothetical protein E3P95_02485 [Wallemia ichthyophaga]TIA99451.1 hypothetical protein E3P94_02534 [Wallemia ichthyophaga]
MQSLRRRGSLIFRPKASSDIGVQFHTKRKEEEKLDGLFVTKRNSQINMDTNMNNTNMNTNTHMRERVYNDIFDGQTRPYSTYRTHQPNNSFDDSSYTNTNSVKSYKYDSVKRKRQHFIHWVSSIF